MLNARERTIGDVPFEWAVSFNQTLGYENVLKSFQVVATVSFFGCTAVGVIGKECETRVG